jgi:hypothetical protein
MLKRTTAALLQPQRAFSQRVSPLAMKTYKQDISQFRVEYKIAVDKVAAEAKLAEADERKRLEEEKAALCVDTGTRSSGPRSLPLRTF